METITARLFELRQKYYEGNGDIIEWDDLVCKIAARLRHAEMKLAESNQKAKNYEEVAHGLAGEVDTLKAQLAELAAKKPVFYAMYDEENDDWEFNSIDEFSCGRRGGKPLFDK